MKSPRVGILGGGQLGRMLALAGHPLGLRMRLLDPLPESSSAAVAETVAGDFRDEALLARFAEGLDVATYEWENVPVAAARAVARHVPLHPEPPVLEMAQDRLLQKTFCAGLGIPVPAFRPIEHREDLVAAVAELGLPLLVKTRRDGYDGKGQYLLREPAQVEAAWRELGGRPLIAEAFVPFVRELSIIAARSLSGEMAYYPLGQNTHREGILRLTVAPAPSLSPEVQRQAVLIAEKIFAKLNYVGVLSIELFEHEGRLLLNEMATRVHNTGHWTIEGAETSQFENHLRAILGWPLGPTSPLGHSAMINIIGEYPDLRPVLGAPGAHVHLYGKSARAGRKLGHVTLRADHSEALYEKLRLLRPIVDPAGAA